MEWNHDMVTHDPNHGYMNMRDFQRERERETFREREGSEKKMGENVLVNTSWSSIFIPCFLPYHEEGRERKRKKRIENEEKSPSLTFHNILQEKGVKLKSVETVISSCLLPVSFHLMMMTGKKWPSHEGGKEWKRVRERERERVKRRKRKEKRRKDGDGLHVVVSPCYLCGAIQWSCFRSIASHSLAVPFTMILFFSLFPLPNLSSFFIPLLSLSFLFFFITPSYTGHQRATFFSLLPSHKYMRRSQFWRQDESKEEEREEKLVRRK